MPTFLTSPKMNPALRERVERAVSQRLRAKQNSKGLGFLPFQGRSPFPLSRLLPVAAFALVVILGTMVHASARRDLEDERSALLARLAERRAELPPGYESFLAATDRFIAESTSETAEDVVLPSLKGGGIDALLRRPGVYLHATATQLSDPKKLDEVAGAAIKDAFLWCLLKAPNTTEQELLAKVRGAYFGGSMLDEETGNVRRLADARMGLEVLGADFESVVRKARDIPTLKRLKKVLDAAPAEQAKQAASATVMILVTDLAPAGGGRRSRVTLVDIDARRVVLRGVVEVPANGAKGSHKDQLEGCGLALAARKRAE